jgi:cytochrome c biogenesis factor
VLYAGPPGVALLYVAVLAAAAAFARGTLDARVEELRGAFVNGAVACVVAALLFVLQPFGRLPFTPVDGAGLEPGLHHGAAALGALLGLVASVTLTVPFAGAVAGLAVRAVDPRWIHHAHRWTAGAWLLLSAGGVLRARALYVEPGTPVPWWAQPAVVGSVAVWLAVTATLHGTAAERRRDAMPRWSLAGVAGSWVLAAWATSATSVSATGSPGPAVGVALLAAALVAGVVWWSGGRVGGDDGGAAPAPARRVAAHVAHAGAVLLAIGCASAAWHRGVRVELQPAETTTLASPLGYHYGLTYLGTSRYERGNQIVTAATLALTRSGRTVRLSRWS